MSAPDVPLVPEQVQMLVLHGYVYDHCRYYILTVDNRAAAKSFLAKLLARHWIEPAGHDYLRRMCTENS